MDIDAELSNILQELSERLPKFHDGRINYSKSDTAVVLTCYVRYNGKLLLLKRSDQVSTYQGYWHSVAGYVDDTRCTLKDKALEELREEVSIFPDVIENMIFFPPKKIIDNHIHRIWVVCNILIDLKKQPDLILDFEHTDMVWIDPSEIANYQTVPGVSNAVKLLLT